MGIRFNVDGVEVPQPELKGRDGRAARDQLFNLIYDTTHVGASWEGPASSRER
jgi:hypothetical protein